MAARSMSSLNPGSPIRCSSSARRAVSASGSKVITDPGQLGPDLLELLLERLRAFFGHASMLANCPGHARDCPHHVRASQLCKESHPFGANSMSGRDGSATALRAVARVRPQTRTEASQKRAKFVTPSGAVTVFGHRMLAVRSRRGYRYAGVRWPALRVSRESARLSAMALLE